MSAPAPHFLLFSESRRRSAKSAPSDWRFVLQSLDGSSRLEAADAEPALGGERLELLAVVRGLEALEQPSRVTLVTPSKYVARGMSYGLNDWRENDWNWEHHGQMVPIKNRDLWQRLDRALAFHRVQCRTAASETQQCESQRSESQRSESQPSEPHATAVVRNGNAARFDGAVPSRISTPSRGLGARSEHRTVRTRLAAFYCRVIAMFRRLLERWAEMESPTGRWRIS